MAISSELVYLTIPYFRCLTSFAWSGVFFLKQRRIRFNKWANCDSSSSAPSTGRAHNPFLRGNLGMISTWISLASGDCQGKSVCTATVEYDGLACTPILRLGTEEKDYISKSFDGEKFNIATSWTVTRCSRKWRQCTWQGMILVLHFWGSMGLVEGEQYYSVLIWLALRGVVWMEWIWGVLAWKLLRNVWREQS